MIAAGIKRLDPQDSVDVESAARLHRELLPSSPVPRLGQAFMCRFYYRKLIEDGLICCDLYYDHGKAVGFIVYTKHASDFMARGLRRHWLYLSVLMAAAVLRRPTRIGVILSLLGISRTLKESSGNSTWGELLSLGVIPECRNSQYVRRTGRRISLELVEQAKEYFRAEHVSGFRGMVEARNRETLLFYHALGCEFQQVPGRRGETIQVIYQL